MIPATTAVEAISAMDVVVASTRIGALALLAGAITTVAAFVFRWYSAETVPEGVAVLLGLSGVALVLNTTATLGLAIGGTTDHLEIGAAVFTIGAFVVATIGADLGRRLGDRLGNDFSAATPRTRRLDVELTQLVRSKGRVLRIALPEQIEDIEGYDPVREEVKAEISGTTLVFPKRLTVGELRERLVDRLKEDYKVGHVDVEVTADGTVEYLAVGSRAAGIGQTLAPDTVAVAVRADPAFSASPGDTVQVWTGGSDPKRLVRGELRSVAEDVVTLAVDATDAGKLDDTSTYRLVTLPSEVNADREFASLLRAADETMGSIRVGEDSSIVDRTVGEIDVTVAAIGLDGDVDALPKRDRVVRAGETIYAMGRPEQLRRLEADARGSIEPTEVSVPAVEPIPED